MVAPTPAAQLLTAAGNQIPGTISYVWDNVGQALVLSTQPLKIGDAVAITGPLPDTSAGDLAATRASVALGATLAAQNTAQTSLTTIASNSALGATLAAQNTAQTSLTAIASNTAAQSPIIVGYGTIAVTTTSASIGTVGAGPGSATWAMPLTGGRVTVTNRKGSAAAVYVSPLGGTATTGGIEIGVGTSASFYVGKTTTTPPTIIGVSTATVDVSW